MFSKEVNKNTVRLQGPEGRRARLGRRLLPPGVRRLLPRVLGGRPRAAARDLSAGKRGAGPAGRALGALLLRGGGAPPGGAAGLRRPPPVPASAPPLQLPPAAPGRFFPATLVVPSKVPGPWAHLGVFSRLPPALLGAPGSRERPTGGARRSLQGAGEEGATPPAAMKPSWLQCRKVTGAGGLGGSLPASSPARGAGPARRAYVAPGPRGALGGRGCRALSSGGAEYKTHFAASVTDPERFWGKAAEQISWYKPWTKTLENRHSPSTSW